MVRLEAAGASRDGRVLALSSHSLGISHQGVCPVSELCCPLLSHVGVNYWCACITESHPALCQTYSRFYAAQVPMSWLTFSQI